MPSKRRKKAWSIASPPPALAHPPCGLPAPPPDRGGDPVEIAPEHRLVERCSQLGEELLTACASALVGLEERGDAFLRFGGVLVQAQRLHAEAEKVGAVQPARQPTDR